MEEKTFAELLTAHMKSMSIGDKELAQKIKKITGQETFSRHNIYNWRTGEVKRPNYGDQVTACADVLGLTQTNRVVFLAAAGCPYNQAIAESPELQKDVIAQRTYTDIEDNSHVFPVGKMPINSPHQFFGREKELKRIFGRWKHIPLHNVAVYGERRSGKTSLLHYIKNIHTAAPLRDGQRHDWLPSGYQFVFVDFKAAGMCEEEKLLRYILQELNLTLPSPCDLFNFTHVMRNELQQNTVILMDQIDVGLLNLNSQFWDGIRSLVSNYTHGKLGLLVASRQLPTQVMPVGGDNQPSPFLNIIGETVKLGPFTDNEARELLEHTPQPFAETDVEWILEKSGRQPALLQMLCDARLTAPEEGETGEGWKGRVGAD